MSTQQTHELKTWPVYFQRVWEGDKPFEIRLDDRGYQKGDTVVLREWDRKAACACPLGESRGDHADDCARYSGRRITARIGFVMASTPPRGNQRGFVGMGYVVFSLVDLVQLDARPKGQPIAVQLHIDGKVVAEQDLPPVSPAAAAQQIAAAAARQEARR